MTEETIFATALEKANAAAREAFLAEACGQNVDLRRRVESLLAASEIAGSFLKEPIAGTAPDMTRDNPTLAHTKIADDEELEDTLAFLKPSTRPGSIGRIDHYDVLEVLGRGGFGIVFRAYDETLQRVVAVKVLAPSMATTSPARKRFLREARSSAAVRHDNVVQVHAVEEQPLPYLVMEYIPGDTLQQRIDKTGPLDISEVLRIGRQVAEGLAAAHATGLIHRDIKPSNVLIDNGPQQRVKITDFGLARAADDASLTRSGVVAGTPLFMAPEQAKGETLDHRADLFSLGSVLYVMCTGRPPFRANTTLAVLKRVAEDEPRPIREVIPEVPEWFCRIVEKLHAKKPEDRYQTAREVADVLADCERQLKGDPELKDFSKIPQRKASPQKFRRFTIILGIFAAVFWLVLIFGEPLYRYYENQGVLEIHPSPGLIAVAIRKEGDRDSIRYDFQSVRSIVLPPGQYTIDPVFKESLTIDHWDVTTRGIYWKHQINWEGLIIPHLTLGRGEELTIRAVLRDNPTAMSNSPSPPTTPTDGWAPLFNGKDLTGWTTSTRDPSAWRVKDGALQAVTTTPIFSDRALENYRLRVVAKLAKDGEATLLVGVPTDQPANTPHTGMKVRLVAKESTTRMSMEADEITCHMRANEWFTVEFLVRGGQQVEEAKLVGGPSNASRPGQGKLSPAGRIGIQTLDLTGFECKKIEVQELPALALPSDKERLQGYWVAQSGEREGKPFQNELLNLHMYFYGRHVFFLEANHSDDRAFTLDPTTNPKQFNFSRQADGKTNLGIYRLEGDQLELCMGEGKERPTEFKSSKTEPWPLTASFKREPSKEPGWTPLFNGRELIGWDPQTQSGKWQVAAGGILTGTGSGYLRSQRDYVNFHLRAEVRIGEDGHSGISFRVDRTLALDAKAPVGYQALINSTDQRNPRTGSLLDSTGKYVYGKAPPVPADTWFRYEIIAVDNDITLKVNGVETLDGPHGDRARSLGPVGLILPGDGKTVSFRNIEIKELPGTPRGTAKLACVNSTVKPLEDLIASIIQTRDNTKTRHGAGVASKSELITAEIDLLDARIKLAETKKDHAAVVGLLGELVTQHQADRDLIEKQVKVGTVGAEELNKADARLAEAKARLAKARSGAISPVP